MVPVHANPLAVLASGDVTLPSVESVETPRPRPYRPEDLSAVLRFVGECYARTGGCGYLHPGDVAHFMSNGLRGRNLDRHIALYESPDGQLQAVMLIQPGLPASFDLMVAPEQRGGDLERELVAWVERASVAVVGASGEVVDAIGGEVADCDTVRRNLLLQLGYVPAADPYLVSTTRSLEAPIPIVALPDGFSIRSVAGEHEVELVAAVHDSAFRPKWAGEAYLPVMRTPGYDVERELVVVAPDGRFAAYLIYWLDPISRSGLFEPVGCHADFRQRGLTKALMYEGMRRMRARGMQTAIVLHHADNPASTALYASVSFRPAFSITDYRKPVIAAHDTLPGRDA